MGKGSDGDGDFATNCGICCCFIVAIAALTIAFGGEDGGTIIGEVKGTCDSQCFGSRAGDSCYNDGVSCCCGTPPVRPTND